MGPNKGAVAVHVFGLAASYRNFKSELANTAEQKMVFDFVGRVELLARPIATNYDVPPEHVAALRRAFDATMKGPEFLGEAKRQLMEIEPTPGEVLQQLVAEIVNALAGVVEKVRQAVR